MSDDLVNQITLNFLISKQQLQKLNKRIKQKEDDTLKSDKEIYKDKINELFIKFMNDEFPDDLLQDVRNSFTGFVEKSIYYLKLQERDRRSIEQDIPIYSEENEEGENEEDEEDEEDEENEEDEDEEDIQEDIKEDEDIQEDEDKEEDEDEDILDKPHKVFKKTSKVRHSEGVDDIQHLPLDWFTKVRCNYKQNQIIQERKDIVAKSPNYKKAEKKNITNLYEDKKNKK